MVKLFKLEYQKLRSTNYFKILSLFWLLAFIAIPIGFQSIVSSLTPDVGTNQVDLMNPGNWPIFDFADLWQNLTYVYKMITIFLCLNLVISTASEFRNKTIRQNVIDGLSKKEFWLSKMSFILVTSVIATLALFVLGLIAGFIYSPVVDFEFIFQNAEFVLAYFLHLIHFLLFTFFVTILLRRGGLAIALILFYVYIIEPLISAVLYFRFDLEFLSNSLPVESGWTLIRNPFFKYIFQDIQDYVAWSDIGMAIFWIFIFAWGSFRLLTKRDL